MADTGKIAIEGFSAGAIKYVVLQGFVPNPAGPSALQACLATLGFGTANAHKVALLGFVGSAAPPSAAGAYPVFGGTVIG
jgi:hypothetical protein